MPYRRLPNTDIARFRALKTAFEKSENVLHNELAFSQNTLQNTKRFLPIFEQTIDRQKIAFENQVSRNRDYSSLFKKSKLYISHFIQILNFAILRGEIPVKARTYYGLNPSTKKVPALKTEAEVIKWGKIIIDGERERIAYGGDPMTNPTIAVVKVWYERFVSSYQLQKDLQKITVNNSQKVSELRKEADGIILKIWNEVEEFYGEFSENEKRELSKEYGLTYVFRKSEKEETSAQKMADRREKKIKQIRIAKKAKSNNINQYSLVFN